jgi:hypothetical protein
VQAKSIFLAERLQASPRFHIVRTKRQHFPVFPFRVARSAKLGISLTQYSTPVVSSPAQA